MGRRPPDAGDSPAPSFEDALERLEEIVEHIEGEELELAEALALFEEGVRLLRASEAFLRASEARVEQLLEEGESFRLQPFTEER